MLTKIAANLDAHHVCVGHLTWCVCVCSHLKEILFLEPAVASEVVCVCVLGRGEYCGFHLDPRLSVVDLGA